MADDFEGDSRRSDDGEDSVDDLLSELADIFATNFRNARLIHLQYEADTGERYIQMYANFRDALTHTARFVLHLDNGEPEKAKEELGQVEDHLERIIYDTEKRRVENRIDQVHQRRVSDILYRLTFLEAPSFDEHQRRMKAVKNLYLLARNKRGDSIDDVPLPVNDVMDWTGNPPEDIPESDEESSSKDPEQLLDEAREKAENLLEETPPKKEVIYRGIILVGVFIAAISLIISL